MRFRLFLFAVFTIFAMGASASVKCDTITAAMRAEDARFSLPVSLDASSISVGELLVKISELTGVRMQTDEHDSLSGLGLCVSCDKVPLGNVLDSLWSLLSYQDAVWKWERNGKAGAFRYEFTPTRAAIDFPRRMKQFAQEAFEAHTATMLAVAVLPPEERKKHLSQISASMLQKDNQTAGFLMEKNGFDWDGLKTFAQGLTPAQQKNTLQGQSVQVTLAQLSEAAQASFHKSWSSLNPRRSLPSGEQIPYPEPTAITFRVEAGQPFMKSLVPVMYVEMGGLGSFSMLGGSNMECGMRDKLADLWMLAGDTKTNSIEEHACTAPAAPDGAPPSRPASDEDLQMAIRQGRSFSAATAPDVLQIRFGQLAHSLPVALLALLPSPDQQAFDPGTPYNHSAREFLTSAIGRSPNSHRPPNLMVKWRGDTLLVSYPTWYMEMQSLYPYALVQQLHRAEKNGFVPWRDLAQTAAQMDETQWRDLCINLPLLRYMQDAHSFLLLCAAYPVLLQENGLNLSSEALNAARNVSALNRFLMLFDGTVAALRVQTVRRVSTSAKISEMQVQYRAADRKWKPLMGYYQQMSIKP